MIRSDASGFAELASRLTGKAQRLAQARSEMRLRIRRRDAGRWRDARLLWPLFLKDD